MSTVMPLRMCPMSSDLGSKAGLRLISTWMGDRFGIQDAVGV